MKRGLPINVRAIYIDFVVIKKSDTVMDVRMLDRVEENVRSDLLD